MKRLIVTSLLAIGLTVLLLSATAQAAEKLKALIVDGRNNHNWQATTPVLKSILEDSGRFTVDVATAPPKGEDLSGFHPNFPQYDVVVSNYNGQLWPKQTREDFVHYVRSGGGFVVVHAANNSFPNWPEYNRMIGLGGWGGRNQEDGPYVYFRDGEIVRDDSPGRGGHHGRQHEFVVTIRKDDHPITKGLPKQWKHAKDELYDSLRGPAEQLSVLATAYSDPETGGTDKHEPMLMTIGYDKGRIFHTPMGHSPLSMRCVGFGFTLQRGAEWAATGEVTLNDVPEDFPTKDKVSIRK